jgi:hypothetical protein
MIHAQTADPVATGDTTKTNIGTISLPSSARRIIGVWCYAVGGATLTSAEAVTGIFELESPDAPLNPMQLPLDIVDILTSGAVAFQAHIIPVDIPVRNASAKVTGYVTMDMAQTGALKARWGIITECAD